jgi:hypothetical protein
MALSKNFRKARQLWRILSKGYGWNRSAVEARPVMADGSAIPWYTYPAIEFLNTLDFSGRRIFEFGCGNSSMFWSSKAEEVCAVDIDPAWVEEIRGYGIKNLRLSGVANKADYVRAPEDGQGTFYVVVIDGKFRFSCVDAAQRAVSDDGFIIFDNADWFDSGCEKLRAAGWIQIDFAGPGPFNEYFWTTSIFVRPQTKMRRLPNVSHIGHIHLGKDFSQDDDTE